MTKIRLWSPVAPAEAIRHFENKDLFPTWSYKDIWREQHAHAFVVAKCADMDLLREIHQSIDHALKQGWSYDKWYKNIAPAMQKRGWWGKGRAYNPKTGKLEPAQLGSPRRLKIIFQTNMRTIHAGGRWSKTNQLHQKQPRYLQYIALRNGNRRPDHQDKQGVILPFDDPFWDHWYPPNGWNCKCTVRSYTKIQLDSRGLSPSKRPDVPMVDIIDPDSGDTIQIPQGISPAFAYNVGRSYSQNMRGVLIEKARQLEKVTGNDELMKAVFNNWVYAKAGSEVLADGKTKNEFIGIAHISEERRKHIPVGNHRTENRPKTGVVIMNGRIARKQRKKHDEILTAHYSIVQEMLDKGKFGRDTDKPYRYSVYYEYKGLYWTAIIEIPPKEKGNEILLLSLSYSRRKNKKRIK